jgi:hypothetical protein
VTESVQFAKPCARAEGRKQLLGYVVITDDKVLHVSPKGIYLKILLVGFVPYLLFGGSIAKRHALEWAANPPERTRVIPLDSVVAVKRGQFRMNRKAPTVVSSDGQELTLGMPYKNFQPAIAQALAGRQVSIEAA